MLKIALLFFLVAIAAALFRFGGVEGVAVEAAKIFALIFIVLAIFALFGGKHVDTGL